ncbi:FAD-binding protein [Sphingomonas sp. 7/4-4]|uniref:FAD-binding protein n=1 Tax=Sphingomonas sp. 7/4-4 TaxID=3018446 RepID=UPI0022F3C6AE|nr:FAD-binding protein [Sphingomonas sp. 7/4-4]WBY08199.1 FAD-binding protein [Sphingomonas sp. 7/4-4]
MTAAAFDPAAATADVIIVGSGAAGGMAAYSLTKAGLRCLMLEAGRDYDPQAEVNMMAPESDAPCAGRPRPTSRSAISTRPWGRLGG